MSRKPKVGEIYEVILDDKLGYFQYIANDESSLGAGVIRAFKKHYDVRPAQLEELTIDNSGVAFYARTWAIFDIPNVWNKVGILSDVGDYSHILFSTPVETGYSPDTKVVSDWNIWHINGIVRRTNKVTDHDRESEPGEVMPYVEIVNRMKYGKYLYKRPTFE